MIEVKINALKKQIDVNIEGKFTVVVSELMVIIENVVNTLNEYDCEAKEIVKGFLIESIGEL